MTGFYSCYKTDKNFKSLYGFGGCRIKLTDVKMDIQPYFRVYNLVSVKPKSIKLDQMTNFVVIFYMVVSN